MKNLKLVKFTAIIILLFSNLAFLSVPNDDQYTEVYFSDKLDINDLARIQSQMVAKEIKLNYDYLKFNSDGKLKEIEFHVRYKKVAGSDKTQNTHTEIGFIINTDSTPQAKYGIIVGEKDKIQKMRMSLEKKNE